jgi:surface-anchored protein
MHLNWGFTAAGVYQVTFEASAFLNGHGLPTRSADVTFTFGVEDTGLPPSPPGGGAVSFNAVTLHGGMIAQRDWLSTPLAPVQTNVQPAQEAVPLLSGQSADRFFSSLMAAPSGSNVHALTQQEAQAQRVDGFGSTLGTDDTLMV